MSEMDLDAAVEAAGRAIRKQEFGSLRSRERALVLAAIEAAAPLIAAAALRDAAGQVIDDPAGLNTIPAHRVKAWLRKRAERIEAAA